MGPEKSKVTILVVDDNAQNLMTAEAILSPEGYNIVVAISGKDALKYLLDHEVALVILDVLMPGLDGFETARAIRGRSKTSQIPIIFTSGYQVDEHDVHAGYELGAIDYITLPLVPHILKSKVAALVSLHLKEKELIAQMERVRELEKVQFVQQINLMSADRERERWNLERAFQQKEMIREQATATLLQEKAAILERTNKELNRFSTMVAHDLQEPLRTISCYLSLLGEEIKDTISSQGQSYMKFASDAATRMSQLITDLLRYSQIGSRAEVNRDDCKLDVVIGQAIQNLSGSIQASGAKIEYKELPTVLANEAHLVQVAQNLISNAIKFSPDRPAHIRITAVSEGDLCTISFKDNGIGIPPEHFGRIFDVFERLHDKSHFPGTGVGLAICKKIIENHGGKIWVESVPGEGATFFFTLPLANQRAVFSGLKVLVVDDDSAMGELFSHYYSAMGMDIDTVESGKSALAKLVTKIYDVIVLDIQMPEMDGFATIRAIRESGINTPTVAYTGMDFKNDPAPFLEAGFYDVVSKNKGPAQLTPHFERWLHS